MELYPVESTTNVTEQNIKILATGDDQEACLNDSIVLLEDAAGITAEEEQLLLENIVEPEIYDNQNEDISSNDHTNPLELQSEQEPSDDGGNLADPLYEPNEESDTHSNNETDEEELDNNQNNIKGKTRKRNPIVWKKNIRKKKRAAGLEYLSSKNKIIPKKEIKEACREGCRKKITINERLSIHTQFYNKDLDINQKRQFIASCIEEVPVERVRVRTGSRVGKRKSSLNYFFTVNNKKVNICRTYFLNTLNLSQTSVRFALRKRHSGGLVTVDQRGKHEPSNKIGANERNMIKEHISKFPCIESHYSRNKSQKKVSRKSP
ncbi:hypothetical protein NQ315_012228 [Exocentrus adspersus]|uniref:Uncharacterized protein n=1 Tax=Exocentrus adspersus TaxID=1586481 RepID=A0AAV8VB15_9CUCU|nr:hypothetical protein NQ315_012228 [Exocentrus adspersus]